MSDEETTFSITYDSNDNTLYLDGQFIERYATFRQKLSNAVYRDCRRYDDEEDGKKERTIHFVISNCDGGNIRHTFALTGLMRMYQKKMPIKYTLHCLGALQSSATLFMTSDVFSKVTLDRNCRIKLHEVQTEIPRGTNLVKRQFAVFAAETTVTENAMCAQYRDFAAKRGKTHMDWQKVLDSGNNDPCFTAEQAFEIGLCDEVI